MQEGNPNFSVSVFRAGPYKIELAHKGEIPPEYGVNEAYFPGGPQITLREDKLDMESTGIKSPSVLHLNQLTLAEKQFKDIRKEHNFSLIPHAASSIDRIVGTILQTVSEISPRFGYYPISYLSRTLDVDPLDYLEQESLNSDWTANTLALLKTMGYYEVEKDIDPIKEDLDPAPQQEIKKDTSRIADLARRTGCEDRMSEITSLFEQTAMINKLIYDEKSPGGVLERLKKPKDERFGIARADFQFPLELIGCALYEKFGKNVSDRFFREYFVFDIWDEKDRAQAATKDLTSDRARSETQKAVEEAKKSTNEYIQAKEKITREVSQRIIDKNINDLRLFIGGLHFYEDVWLIDNNEAIPELARFSVAEEKGEGGRRKRRYFLEDKETALEELTQEERLIIDALENLRKKGDNREIGFFEVGKNQYGLKIDFNRIKLFASGIMPTEELTGEEAEMLHKMERMIEQEFEFCYEKEEGSHYSVHVGQREIGEVTLPRGVTPAYLKELTLFDLLKDEETEQAEEEIKRNIEVQDAWYKVYQMLPPELRLSDEDASKVMTGEATETAHRASISKVRFQKDPRNRYGVKRKLRSTGKSEELGMISLSGNLEELEEKPLAGIHSLDEMQKRERLELSRMKFSGVDYFAENGHVWVTRKAGLDELMEGLHHELGTAGSKVDMKLVRITHQGNREFYERLLEAYLNDRKISPEERMHLLKERKEKNVALTNDDIRRMMLQAKATAHRGIFDRVQHQIAEYARDGVLEVHEDYVIEDLFVPVLRGEQVPQDLINFINKRKRHAVRKIERKIPEQTELLELITKTVIGGKGSFENNKDYSRLLQVVGDMTMPPENKEAYFTEMRNKYSTRFLMHLTQLIDEMPDVGEDVFADSFYAHFETSKGSLVKRIKKLLEDEGVIEQVKAGFDSIMGPFGGMEEEKFKKYARALARLPKEVREKVKENMQTHTGKDHVGGEILNYLNNELLTEEALNQVMSSESVEKAMEGGDEEAVDDAFASAFGMGRSEKPVEQELYQKYKEREEKIKKEGGITDQDLEDLFGEEEGF